MYITHTHRWPTGTIQPKLSIFGNLKKSTKSSEVRQMSEFGQKIFRHLCDQVNNIFKTPATALQNIIIIIIVITFKHC